MEKEDYTIKIFMGTKYDIGNPESVGELKAELEKIIEDLPEDKERKLKISEVNYNLDYTLEEGLSQ